MNMSFTVCPQCNAPTVKNTVMGRNMPRHEFTCTHCKYTVASTLSAEERAIFNVKGMAGLKTSEKYYQEA